MYTAAQSADRWRRNYPRLKAFHTNHGHVDVGPGPLKLWLMEQIRESRSAEYSEKRRKLLEALGVQFSPDVNLRVWSMRMSQLRDYIEAHGTWQVRNEERDLQIWLSGARRDARAGLVPAHLVSDLKALGVSIEPLKPGPRLVAKRPLVIPGPPAEEYGAADDCDLQEPERPF